jgi:hypothetical protein
VLTLVLFAGWNRPRSAGAIYIVAIAAVLSAVPWATVPPPYKGKTMKAALFRPDVRVTVFSLVSFFPVLTSHLTYAFNFNTAPLRCSHLDHITNARRLSKPQAVP